MCSPKLSKGVVTGENSLLAFLPADTNTNMCSYDTYMDREREGGGEGGRRRGREGGEGGRKEREGGREEREGGREEREGGRRGREKYYITS